MRIFLLLLAGCMLGLSASGCQKSKPEASHTADHADDSHDSHAHAEGSRSRKTASRDGHGSEVELTSAERPGRVRSGKLELNLNPGDRFPLSKVIDVELVQASQSGKPETSRRRLEMMLLIEVSEKLADRTRLSVHYDRVKYVREIGPDKLEYDSRTPPASVPFDVRMYHDMVKDGFSFWINSENRIIEADDFRAFLNRCLRNIPEDRRQQALLAAEGASGENGISDFVDNSIGLLPFGYHKPGDTWERSRSVGRPVPMQVRNTYKLEELNHDTALISITGTVGASTTLSEDHAADELRVTVTGGHTNGECTVFRDTGLPRSSRVQTVVDMLVAASGVEFRQQQKTTTTIEAYPVVSGSASKVIGITYEEQSRPRLAPR